MNYQITYAYSGHSEILSESTDLFTISNEYESILDNWKLQPHDQYLELESVDGKYDYQTIAEHTFNKGNWECED